MEQQARPLSFKFNPAQPKYFEATFKGGIIQFLGKAFQKTASWKVYVQICCVLEQIDSRMGGRSMGSNFLGQFQRQVRKTICQGDGWCFILNESHGKTELTL